MRCSRSLIGAVPSLLLSLGALAAARIITQSLAVSPSLTYGATGYTLAPGQWLPGLVWIAALILGGITAIPLLRAECVQARPISVASPPPRRLIQRDLRRSRRLRSQAPPGATCAGPWTPTWTTPGRGRILDELEGGERHEEDDVEVEAHEEEERRQERRRSR